METPVCRMSEGTLWENWRSTDILSEVPRCLEGLEDDAKDLSVFHLPW